jgi:hypothetical protein
MALPLPTASIIIDELPSRFLTRGIIYLVQNTLDAFFNSYERKTPIILVLFLCESRYTYGDISR